MVRFSVTKLRKIFVAISFCYLIYKIRKFLIYIKYLSNEEHTILSKNILVPSEHLFANYFQNNDGLWIYHRDWILPLDVGLEIPKGIIIIAHGYAEHINRYNHLATYLNKNGFSVYGIDFQGHGNSHGDNGYFKSFECLINDLLSFSQRIKEEYPNIPLFILGHSMGGLVVCNSALKSQNNNLYNGGVILSSPFFIAGKKQQITITPTILNILTFIDKKLPKLPFGFVNNKQLSHDISIVYKIKNDKLHYTNKYTIRVGKELMYAGESMLNNNSKNVKYPFLIFGGGGDTIADPDAWTTFYNNTKTDIKDKEIKIYQGLLHETLNEIQPHSETVFKDLLEWIHKRLDILNENKNINNDTNNDNIIMDDLDDDISNDISNDNIKQTKLER